MPRYKLTLEYDGAPFAGWQRQADQPSVQERVETAVEALTGVFSHVQGAGRTDAGVHALAQVAHVDLAREWDEFRLREALNHHLRPAPVAVLAVEKVDGEFHARFSATERLYLYRIVNRRPPLTFERGTAWKVRNPLDVKAMREGAAHLVGHHDFTTFRSSMCQAKSPVKTVDEISVQRDGDKITVHVRARSFLHNQVRSFVGTLERVGAGAWAPGDVKAALEACDRAACGPVAPPDGLYLAEVRYASVVGAAPQT
ncbi:tRNA pseudouridine(38-40) synthase TruA [Pikeienuella piscinae]|uniref:tRNA pseudouridine synthase A n=1 Tax=Pikeienuella piscinae TaxID=2748098 RepID=A0A7L5BZV2_9RHOB|nr:tRNA pseudouridine(38-40) synthase TruA [Pikeienuella piscinae]QIE56368.1 tRNA pseudouridine(38-40) synthase TruA [Pikeienuella piscinae]